MKKFFIIKLIVIILMTTIITSGGCKVKKITPEEAKSFINEYCEILQKKAAEHSGSFEFGEIEEKEDELFVFGKFVSDNLSFDIYRVNFQYDKNYLIFGFSYEFGKKFNISLDDSLAKLQIMFEFANLILKRQFTVEIFQDFMQNEKYFMKENKNTRVKYLDFWCDESICYYKEYEGEEYEYEEISIVGKTKNLI